MIINFSTSDKLRLDEFLRLKLPSKLVHPENASNSKIRRLIVSGVVFVNGKQCRRPAFELRGKSAVSIDFDEEKFFYEKQPDDVKFEVSAESVLFEDEYIICVNKPANFPTEETIVGGQKRDNLHDAVVRYLWQKNPSLRNPPYVGIMHRLDRGTSGVILFTKQRSVNKDVQAMFESHDFKKIYYALCEASNITGKKFDIHSGKKFSVEMYMNRLSSKSQAAKWGKVPKENGGLYSKTDFEIIEKRKNGHFLVKADLYTGRTHQIRVHLSSVSLPIFGDELYGASPSERVMLHAERLEFVHPVTKQNICVIAPLPF